MYFLKLFEHLSDYENFKGGMEWITPNVSLIANDNVVKYQEYIAPPSPISLCDIAYWDGSKVKTIAKDKYSTSLGIAIGVVVIPEGMLPDSKARIMGLKPVDANGNASDTHIGVVWDEYCNETNLTKYTKVPTTDNAASTSTGSSSYGYLPSDKFTGKQSYIDGKTKYNSTSKLIPSPYLGDDKTMNPEYIKEISGNNALSDFNGLENTNALVNLGPEWIAANAAWNYSDGISNVQWYLPAMGELGFLMPRFNEINKTLAITNGVLISNMNFWSSSEYSIDGACGLYIPNGSVGYDDKFNQNYVRVFAAI